MYVAYPYINAVEKFTPQGAGTVFANSGLNHPENVAFDSFGNLYVACTGDNSIQKVTHGGVRSLFANTA